MARPDAMSARERDEWEQEQARREEIAREEREGDRRERMRVRIVDTNGHEWGCPNYNQSTFTNCTCAYLSPEQAAST